MEWLCPLRAMYVKLGMQFCPSVVNPLPPNVPDLEHQICQWTTNGSQEDLSNGMPKTCNGCKDLRLPQFLHRARNNGLMMRVVSVDGNSSGLHHQHGLNKIPT